MRQTHRGGDKMFVDYSGDGIDITDPENGEVTESPLFVAMLGRSAVVLSFKLVEHDSPIEDCDF